MNDVIKNMIERRSVRKFKPDMPARELIDQVIQAGLYAPSGMNVQGSIIIAITNKEQRDKLAALNATIMGAKGADPFYGAPVVLIVLDPKNAFTKVYDGSLVMGNLLNAAHALGLGGIWIHRAKEEFETPEYQQLLADLGIEGEWEGIGHCALGYADCDLPTAPARKPGRVYFED